MVPPLPFITTRLQRIQELKWFVGAALLAVLAALFLARRFRPVSIGGAYTAVRPGQFVDEDQNSQHGTVAVTELAPRLYEVAHTKLGDFGLQFTSQTGGIVQRHTAYKTFSFHPGRQALTLRTLADKELVLHRVHPGGVDAPR